MSVVPMFLVTLNKYWPIVLLQYEPIRSRLDKEYCRMETQKLMSKKSLFRATPPPEF